ncbi:unnamed protein product, partial [Ascophyllum nodosum]
FGLPGSKKGEFCSKHASRRMVNVKNKKCNHRECSKHPSYGDAQSGKVEYCAEHASEGMVYVRGMKRCSHRGCR